MEWGEEENMHGGFKQDMAIFTGHGGITQSPKMLVSICSLMSHVQQQGGEQVEISMGSATNMLVGLVGDELNWGGMTPKWGGRAMNWGGMVTRW